MNTLYLVCSRSCMAQMEIPYLLNNSPELHGTSSAGEHYATYQLDGNNIDHEPGILGTVRCHDDYWNLSEEDSKYYNFEIRNELEIREDQLDELLNIVQDKSIALLLHAQNYKFIWKWSRNKPVIIINTIIGDWDMDIENWAMREYNDIMEDDRNANYSGVDHTWPGCKEVAQNFLKQKNIDKDILELESDVLLTQADWMQASQIYKLWDKVKLMPPEKEWISAYIQDIKSKQQYNTELLSELRVEYDSIR